MESLRRTEFLHLTRFSWGGGSKIIIANTQKTVSDLNVLKKLEPGGAHPDEAGVGLSLRRRGRVWGVGRLHCTRSLEQAV